MEEFDDKIACICKCYYDYKLKNKELTKKEVEEILLKKMKFTFKKLGFLTKDDLMPSTLSHSDRD